MPIGLLTLTLHLPGCNSLKEKRSRIKPLLARLHREFNISIAEVDSLDAWRESTVVCTMVSNDRVFLQRALQKVVQFCNDSFPDLEIESHRIEML